MDAFVKYMDSKEAGTVRLLGTTLRAFTKETSLYYPLKDEITEMYNGHAPKILINSQYQCETHRYINLLVRLLTFSNVKIEMIVLNPYCLEAYFRAQAEDSDPNRMFNKIEDYQSQYVPCLFSDLQATIAFIRKLRNIYRDRIELKLSFFMNAMFLIVFPDICFTQQYIMDEFASKGGISQIPLLKYRKGSTPYERLNAHFDFIWNRAIPLDEKDPWARGTAKDFMFDIYKKLSS